MIKNERQYRITKAEKRRFERAIALLSQESLENSIHPTLLEAETYALQSQLADLKTQIEEYEALKAGTVTAIEVNSLEELPDALVKARIARGLSQRDLASRLGLQEQQIQRYEATDYSGASLQRIVDIVHALDIRVREDIFLPNVKLSLTNLFHRLAEVGLNRKFVLSRVLPSALAARLNETVSDDGEGPLALRAASAIGRVFNLTPAAIFSSAPLIVGESIASTVRFKAPTSANQRQITAYTVYAHFLALLLLDATPDLPQREVPTDAAEVRRGIISGYGTLTFENALRYVWDLGIPVLPLNDPGAFHGACFRSQGRNVIVLKQQTHSAAWWLFNLLHELRHVGQEPEKAEFSVIEDAETSEERINSADERAASQFAGQVMLNGRAEELVTTTVALAKGNVARFKSAVIQVAKKENIPVPFLANYLAFRVSRQGYNWWGAATNLQELDTEPWKVAQDLFLERIRFDRLNDTDRDILLRAVEEIEA